METLPCNKNQNRVCNSFNTIRQMMYHLLWNFRRIKEITITTFTVSTTICLHVYTEKISLRNIFYLTYFFSGQANVVYHSKLNTVAVCLKYYNVLTISIFSYLWRINDCKPQISSMVTEKGWINAEILGPWNLMTGLPFATKRVKVTNIRHFQF